MDNLALSYGGSLNLVSAALAAAAGNINLNIAVGTNAHIIDGQFYTRAANASQAWTMSDPAVYSDTGNGTFVGAAGGSTRLYVLYMTAAGALIVRAGPIVNTAELAAGRAALQFPSVPPRSAVCFGAVRVALTQGTSFTPGVTATNAAGVTTTFLNLATLPADPLRA